MGNSVKRTRPWLEAESKNRLGEIQTNGMEECKWNIVEHSRKDCYQETLIQSSTHRIRNYFSQKADAFHWLEILQRGGGMTEIMFSSLK